MSPNLAQPEWIQYGSFGLIAFLVIVGLPGGLWWLRNAIQFAFAYHEKIIAGLTKTFTDETQHCRESQEALACRAEIKEEKDRQVRHELANGIQKMNGQLEIMIQRGNHAG